VASIGVRLRTENVRHRRGAPQTALDLDQDRSPTIVDDRKWMPLSHRRVGFDAAKHWGQLMRKMLLGMSILVLLSASAVAEDKMVVDMGKLTCRELTKLGFQDFAGITMWLSGYYNATVRSTVVDLNEFAQAAKTVKDFCQTSPQSTVMSAAERALGIKMPRPR
jgi:hypothetical protein